MATLWNKGTEATEAVERFTVSADRQMDLRLARYDVIGSKAHAEMLCSVGLLSKEENEALQKGLDEIALTIENGDFRLEEDVEDIHSQVEILLTRSLGEVGKKIHSGRSRNDQVLVDLKLYLKDALLGIRSAVADLFNLLQELSEEYKEVLLPGYTHAQLAMPSSFGLWLGGYAEALVNDVHMLGGAFRIADQNPLGSAAGYGNSFPLDRGLTTSLLGFGTMDYNSVAAQLSRGKVEKGVASAIGSVALTLNKLAADCCFYMCPNLGFIKFPDSLTTGSSIMPHKKNPDVWEVMRAKCNRIMSAENEIALLCGNMPHGYHRDYQILKEILFPAIDTTLECLEMAGYMLAQMEVRRDILAEPLYEHLFTVEEVNRRTLDGVPFREAYRQVGIEVNEGRFKYSPPCENSGDGPLFPASALGHTHEGSLGNLCNREIAAKMEAAMDWNGAQLQ